MINDIRLWPALPTTTNPMSFPLTGVTQTAEEEGGDSLIAKLEVNVY